MDNLDKCMIQCKKDGYGCHYGAWRAAQGEIVIEYELPEGWKRCENCQDPFKPINSKQKFCGAYCQRQVADKRHRQKQKEGAENGQAKNVWLLQAMCTE